MSMLKLHSTLDNPSVDRQKAIQAVLTLLDNKMPRKKRELIKLFIENYYQTASLDIFDAYTANDLYGATLNFWLFFFKRKTNGINFRIYNPQDEQHGWQSTHTIIELNCADMPFLVDSMRMAINRKGYNIHHLVHFGKLLVARDSQGQITDVVNRTIDPKSHAESACYEAIIHIEIDRLTDTALLGQLDAILLTVFQDITLAVNDWRCMQDKVQTILNDLEKNPPAVIDKAEISEMKIFLKWIKDDHFTFLGCRDYELIQVNGEHALSLVSGSGLGVLRNETHSKKIRLLSEIAPEIKELVLSPKQILTLTKTNTLATIHRQVYTDYIGVKRYNHKGEVIGETRIIGLYTTTAYNSDPREIPFLRHKVNNIIAMSGLPEKGHSGKDLLNILQTLPRDDLFHASTQELFTLAMGIVQIQERPIIRLFARKDVYGRFISCLVYIPRENFNSDLRQKIQRILFDAFHALEVTFETRFSESILARIHFIFRIDPTIGINCDINAVEKQIIEVSHTWKDKLKGHLIESKGEERGLLLFNEFGNAFPLAYREDFLPRCAVHDIDHISQLSPDNQIEMSFYRLVDDPENTLNFKLFHANNTIPLSDVIPMLENMGLRIIGERPYQLTCSPEKIIWINDFTMQYPSKSSSSDPIVNFDIDAIEHIFKKAFSKIWYGQAENDGFNKLVIHAQLDWRRIAMLRAYAKYLRQTGFMFSQQYIETTLVQYSAVTVLFVKLFELTFDPALVALTDLYKTKNDKITELEKTILLEIEKVSSLDEDRILRRYLDVLKATLRTNYFQEKDYIAFKLNSHAVPELPLPLPLFEVFVYSPKFEAIHLRAAKVARGGIRWSERREDFRTEVLGLMKAQTVKNAVIVPSGAKGGFVPKCLPQATDSNREAIMSEVIDCYKNFMRALLDISDNLVQGTLLSPKDTICFDQNDPYLVVAADKGTATFSDIANGISKEYGFWLGDAFASGGSVGYDHKKMGITARGAWESVKRHFREINMDIQQKDFTVIGIGDMSGDVFGNGLLQSEHIKLIAAFDHRHIFIDPSPEPKKSFQERQRLFHLPRSSWADYQPTLISLGGGVFSRSAKSILLTPEIKIALDISDNPIDTVTPNELIKLLLCANVDLLWNGGIGTYIKATTEHHEDVGDRTNDFVRVNGSELRCRVLGEGGNLGCTQLGRIEYSLNGGLCNTDFIDNSAGVDCSDHEVNIKILLNDMIRNGDLTEKQRNTLLESMTDEIAELVLQDNYQQVLAISLAVVHAKTHAELYRRYLSDQEKLGLIDRELEFLPSDKILSERKVQGMSLTRPELAILLCYSKINIKAAILSSDLPEDPYLSTLIYTAFPKTLAQKANVQITHHSLKREIIATQLSNRLVNTMGAVFVYRMQNETGASVAEIIRAYVAVQEIFNIEELYGLIIHLDNKISADMQIEMLLHIKRLVRRATRWLLRNRRTKLNIQDNIAYFGQGVAALTDMIPTLMVGITRDYMTQITQAFTESGLSATIASRIAGCRAVYTALNIVDIVTQYGFDLISAAKTFFAVGANLELAWFRDQLNTTALEDYWDSLARAALRDELDAQQRALTISILQLKTEQTDQQMSLWLEKHHALLERWMLVLSHVRSVANLNFIIFYVAMCELSDITHLILLK